MKVLGVEFFEGKIDDIIRKSSEGGLIVAPSGPGLSGDLIVSKSYKDSLSKADLVLPDSGLMCLCLKIFWGKSLRRISGLEYLRKILDVIDLQGTSSFWVMPDMEQSNASLSWLKKTYDIDIKPDSVYIAPIYSKNVYIEDRKLLEKIRTKKPKFVFIQVGGGTQERLGLYLKNHLTDESTIICTGAALAFMTGQQVRIPKIADKYYFGWLMRCLTNPKVFVPRYLNAFRLVYILLKFGENSPLRN